MTKKTVYLHFGGEFVGLPDGPFHTRKASVKVSPLNKPSETKTDFKVFNIYFWCRVYCKGTSPNEIYYIKEKGKPIATVQF